MFIVWVKAMMMLIMIIIMVLMVVVTMIIVAMNNIWGSVRPLIPMDTGPP